MSMSTNEPMPQERLDAIQGRLDAATPGPRKIVANRETRRIEMQPHYYRTNVLISDRFAADCALIVHAPYDLTDLLAEVERLRAALDQKENQS